MDTQEPATREYDVVLVGAGVSAPAPSNLPSGDRLTQMAWKWLYGSIEGPTGLGKDVAKHISSRGDGSEAGLRLEQFMEVASRHIKLEQLVTIYDVLSQAEPGFSHRALAQLGLPVVTVNMDLLLERAGVKTTLHLHGNVGDNDTIKTTISQYSRGLESETQSALRRAVEGKRLLVMGYSGRDRDVLPLLVEQFRPASVTWVKHRDDPPIPEIDAALKAWAEHGVDVEVVSSAAQEFLHDELGIDVDAGLYDLSLEKPIVRVDAPQSMQDALRRSVPEGARHLACASVAFELAQYEHVRTILRVPLAPEYGLAAAKLEARCFRREQRPWRAIAVMLGSTPRHGVKPVANETSAALGKTVAWPAARVCNALLIGAARKRPGDATKRVARQARSRQRQREINGGSALRAIRGADYALAHPEEVDLQTWVDELTWIADAFKLRGDYGRALAICERALDDAPYSDFSQRAYLLSKRLEIRLAAGLADLSDPNSPDSTAVKDAEYFAVGSAGHGTEWLWLKIIESACHAGNGSCSRDLLDGSRDQVPGAAGTAAQYFHLHSAEQARFDGDHSLCDRELRRLRGLLTPRSVGTARSWRLAIRMVRLQSAIDLGRTTPMTIRGLERLIAAYRRAGMESGAAWAEISVAQALRVPVPSQRIEQMVGREWHAHAERALDPQVPRRWAVLV